MQLPNLAVGRALPLDKVYDFNSAKVVNEFMDSARHESALLGYCTGTNVKDVLIAASEKFDPEPVVFFSNNAQDAEALGRATLGIASFAAPPAAVQVWQVAAAPPAGVRRPNDQARGPVCRDATPLLARAGWRSWRCT